jgi:hypothetical protein
MATNLPSSESKDSASATRLFFDTYGDKPLEFPASEVSACLAFFENRGFDDQAAVVTSMTLLRQAKGEGVTIFKILDNLQGFDELAISKLVTEILNNNRVPTSTLGYNIQVPNNLKIRNVAA